MNNLSTRKLFCFYAIMIFATIGICFAMIEYGLARYYHSSESDVSLTTFDPYLGWRLRPGTYFIKPRHTLRGHEIFINEYGLRSRQISTNRRSDSQRIIILGDSFTFAMAMPDESTFPVLLERFTSAKGGNYEVINAGVSGYGTAQEMLMMKNLTSEKFVGDVYVLMIFVNDILDNLRLGEYGSLEKTPSQPGFDLHADGTLQLTHYPRKEYSSNFVAPSKSRFFTVEVLENGMKTFLQTRPNLVSLLSTIGFAPTLPRMPSLIYGWYLTETVTPGVPLMKALVSEIRDEAIKNHARLIVSLIPSPIQVYPDAYNPILRRSFPGDAAVQSYLNDPTRPQRIASRMCEELEIPFLDLYPLLLPHNARELFIPADGHFSSDGHAVVAQHLATFVMDPDSDRHNSQSSIGASNDPLHSR